MISAAGVPVIETDVDALDVHAASLTAAGGVYATAGADFHATWQGMGAYYRAPEADYLFASTGPIHDITLSVGGDVETVGSALLTYTQEVREIRTRLDALRSAAVEFEISVAGQPDWSAIPANVDHSNALVAQVSAAVLDFEDAQRRCANAIAALTGGPASRISDGDGVAESGEFGSTAAELDLRAGTGQAVPWGGRPSSTTTPWTTATGSPSWGTPRSTGSAWFRDSASSRTGRTRPGTRPRAIT